MSELGLSVHKAGMLPSYPEVLHVIFAKKWTLVYASTTLLVHKMPHDFTLCWLKLAVSKVQAQPLNEEYFYLLL